MFGFSEQEAEGNRPHDNGQIFAVYQGLYRIVGDFAEQSGEDVFLRRQFNLLQRSNSVMRVNSDSPAQPADNGKYRGHNETCDKHQTHSLEAEGVFPADIGAYDGVYHKNKHH